MFWTLTPPVPRQTRSGVLGAGVPAQAPALVTRSITITKFCLVNCTSIGADWVPSVFIDSMTENPLMGAGVPGSQTAVLGTGLGEGDIAAAAVPLLPGAEVPAFVATVATSWGVVAHTFGINVLRIGIIKAGSMAGF